MCVERKARNRAEKGTGGEGKREKNRSGSRQDLNLDLEVQSLTCCHYTTGPLLGGPTTRDSLSTHPQPLTVSTVQLSCMNSPIEAVSKVLSCSALGDVQA